MKKVLYLFSKFTDQDIDWLLAVGKRQDVGVDHVLIHEGEAVDTLYFTLAGQFKVTASGADIANIGAGEVVGELSFLDTRPPIASVTAVEDSTVMAVPVKRLNSKLKIDTGFASRFYFALGTMLADRMRDTVHKLALGTTRDLGDPGATFGEIAGDMLDKMGIAAVRFDKLRKTLLSG